jgi:hypothetical protein
MGVAAPLELDPEKWEPIFRKDRVSNKSLIPKSGNRFSEKIMRQQKARELSRFNLTRKRSSG